MIHQTKKIKNYIFVMLLYSIHHKKNFFMPSGIELVVRDINWEKIYSGDYSGDIYNVVLESDSNPSVAIYFIVDAHGKGNKKNIFKSLC